MVGKTDKGVFYLEDKRKLLLQDVANQLQSGVSVRVCQYSEKTFGFFEKRWGCKRRKLKGDLCRQQSAQEAECIDCLRAQWQLTPDEARQVFRALTEQHYIQVYRCSAVFFGKH